MKRMAFNFFWNIILSYLSMADSPPCPIYGDYEGEFLHLRCGYLRNHPECAAQV
jgi:hypothetical protein